MVETGWVSGPCGKQGPGPGCGPREKGREWARKQVGGSRAGRAVGEQGPGLDVGGGRVEQGVGQGTRTARDGGQGGGSWVGLARDPMFTGMKSLLRTPEAPTPTPPP